MLPGQRDLVVLGLLQQQQIVTITEICSQCNCSVATARRDLDRLESQGLLRRTHGGAVLVPETRQEATALGSSSALEARLALADRSDALIVTPNKAEATRLLVERCRRAGVPIIAEANKYPGAATVVSVDDYRAGVELGRWLGYYARDHLEGQPKVLEVVHPSPNAEARARGFSDGLREVITQVRVVMRVDEQEFRRPARAIVADALGVHPDINVIFAINDEAALGAVDAYRSAGLDIDQLMVAWFGLEGRETRDMLEQGGPFKACAAMFPEIVGRACVDAVVCVCHQCQLPERIVTPYAIVTAESLKQYYIRNSGADGWEINWPAVQQLSTASSSYSRLGHSSNRPLPARIGWVQVFSSHDWYRNIRQAMQERCRELGIKLEVLDASHDMVREVDVLKQKIGRAAARLVNDGDTIIVDAGITTKYLAQALRGRKGITIFTNSLLVLAELGREQGITLVSSGGVVRTDSLSLTGPAAEATFHDLRANTTFITGTGVSADFGLSNTNIQETGVKQAMLRAAHEVILLADNTKIGIDSLVKIAPLTGIHRLLTDVGISVYDRQTFAQDGVEVLVAED